MGYFKETGSFLFQDDFQAWRYGPVIPTIYRRYSIWGGRKISFCNEADFSEVVSVAGVIDEVIRSKRSMEPWQLVDETHKPGSAWSKVYRGGLGDGEVITKSLLAETVRRG